MTHGNFPLDNYNLMWVDLERPRTPERGSSLPNLVFLGKSSELEWMKTQEKVHLASALPLTSYLPWAEHHLHLIFLKIE